MKDMRKALAILSGYSLILLLGCGKEAPEVPSEDLTGVPEISVQTVITGYEIIWGMDFLPNGNLIFGEKRGRIYLKSGETVSEITGFPQVMSIGQGGLLDIRVHPDYALNGWIYASYSASVQGGGSQLKLIRFKITSSQVSNIENLFSTDGSNTWFGHYGSRIVFNEEGYLFLSIGEGGNTSYGGPGTGNDNALNPQSDWGKIHRLNDNGTIPADNPVFPGNSQATSVYSIGHRNPQGLAVHPVTGELWETEHGPKGGDEINIIRKGANFGWPAYSIGVNYDGTTISASHVASGITPPLFTWTPSVGVCGMAFITNEKFKSWNGSLLVSGLASQKLHRCVIINNTVVEKEILLSNYGRVRNVIQGPDGSIYVSVENPGRIIQIKPLPSEIQVSGPGM
jgi:aldose sugar dehydrogenase